MSTKTVEAKVELTPSLDSVLEAHRIRIHRKWDRSYIRTPPKPQTDENFTLERANQGFNGEASFHVVVPREYPSVRDAVEQISIPAEVMTQYLQMIARIPLEDSPYTPPPFATDGERLGVDMFIESDNETIILSWEWYDESKDYPWRVTTSGKTFLTSANVPMLALKMLEPYLKMDVLRKLTGPE
ncbi:MAG: hypothetical protein WCF84_09240 [Anaerolineae bacterium]